MFDLINRGFTRRQVMRPLLGLALSIFALAQTASTFAAPPQVGDKAPDFTLNDMKDHPVTLSSLLKKGPVVLVLLRGYPGYQCPFCTRQVATLRGKAKEFEKTKAQVVMVYPGPSNELKQHGDEFIHDKALPANFQFVLDPDYTFTKRYDLRWDAPGETSYPSTFVINRDNKIRFVKVSHSHGDRANVDEVLKALEK